MAPKRTRSQANLDLRKDGQTQTKLSWSTTPQRSSSSNESDDDEVAPQGAKKQKAQKPAVKKDPTPAKLYKDALKSVDKTFNGYMKKYKLNPTPWDGITADDFAQAMTSFIPTARELAEVSPAFAFNLVLDLGEHSYGDLDATVKAAGFGESEKPHQELDELLVSLITTRVGADANAGKVPGQAYAVALPHAEVCVEERALRKMLRGKRDGPNKRERGLLDRARRDGLKTLFETRRERRETVEDWAGNALNDLLETGGRIDQYGIGRHYFRKSIDLLAEVKGVARPELRDPPREEWEKEVA
ncbi:hypothetical protein F4781DRAFT_383458 [Annulohypoxylon bovei var. microspora]|nr:hypothetical protein F4781DRAFT_383458 [Annulohypoxylon bovei var. microspora]